MVETLTLLFFLPAFGGVKLWFRWRKREERQKRVFAWIGLLTFLVWSLMVLVLLFFILSPFWAVSLAVVYAVMWLFIEGVWFAGKKAYAFYKGIRMDISGYAPQNRSCGFAAMVARLFGAFDGYFPAKEAKSARGRIFLVHDCRGICLGRFFCCPIMGHFRRIF